MRIQTKPSAILLTGIGTVIALSAWYQNRQAHQQNASLASATTEIVRQREYQNTANLQHSMDFLLADCLERGDMDVFKRIVLLQAAIPGMQEFSLNDFKGEVAFSSNPAALTHSAHGVELTGKVANNFQEIVHSIAEVDKLVAEVAEASNEQDEGLKHLDNAVVEMDKLTQANAAGAGETARSAEQLNGQAHSLDGYFHELVAMVGGDASASENEETAPEKDAVSVKTN